MENIILHICCGVCGLSLWDELSKNYRVTGLWYNPNIYPEEEYTRRKEALQSVVTEKQIVVTFIDEFGGDKWLDQLKNIVNTGLNRCLFCYRERLTKTAQTAQKNGIQWFTTTLLTSPYQDLEQINLIGTDIAQQYHLNFLFTDFRHTHYPGINRARELNIYRQKYCGCSFSKTESDDRNKQRKK